MDKQFKTYILIVVGLAVGILLIVTLIYWINFSSYRLSNNTADWGQFGAYIGGVAGVFLTLLTIILLIITIYSQNRNATISQFESSFFELLRLHKEITDRIGGTVDIPIIYESGGIEFKGLMYFEKLSKEIQNEFDDNLENIMEKLANPVKFENILEDKMEMQKIIDSFYNELYQGRESELGHYFRSLYHLIKFVNDSSIGNKKRYVDLIQAYLTDAELHCTFYNGIAIYGRKHFQTLLDDYSFLENIKPKGDIFEKQFEMFYPKTFDNYKNKPRPIE
jgi:hypothetical protein